MTFETSPDASVQQILTNALAARPRGVRQDVDETVAAIVTVESDRRYLAATIGALLAGRMLPGVIVVADCSGDTPNPVYSTMEVVRPGSGRVDHLPDVATVQVQLVPVESASSFGDAVGKSLRYARLSERTECLWLLHDDSRPKDEGCLETLVEAHRNVPTASVIGAKQVGWDGIALHNVGYYAAPHHHVASLVVDGEPDQEQYDGRQDVFAVSLAGALVSLETWKALGGTDGWFTSLGESKDFCRRVCLSGGRVIVVPKAVIAHRRARLDGIRTRVGDPVDGDDAANTYPARILAAQRYAATGRHRVVWPLDWLWLLIAAFGRFFTLLFGKKPYEAFCELALPWRALAGLPRAFRARGRVSRQTTTAIGKLGVLVANRQQMARWRERTRAFESQRFVTLLSPLAKAHLTRQWRVRATWAAVMALALAVGMIILRWDVLRGLFAGGVLASPQLLPTGASFRQPIDAATIPYTYALGTGVAGPPTPFLLVLAGASVLTGGHVAAAMALIYLMAAPLSALSFWALAGVFTRSNPVRVVCGVLWGVLAGAMGLYHSGNLAMLVVMIFLPAAFAFTFRATAMYLTEDPIRPVPSVQRAALASLCFIPVVDAEPQMLLPLVLVFLAFLILVRRHRPTLLLIPVPAAFTLAPTLVNVAHRAVEGQWRELFADVMLPSSDLTGEPAALSLADVTARSMGLESAAGWEGITDPMRMVAALAVACALVLAVVSVIALFMPSSLRMSRMMWVVMVAGAALSLTSTRVAVGLDADGAVAGSALPGFAMMMMGVISCVCQVAGAAVKRFNPLAGMPVSRRLVGGEANHANVTTVHAASLPRVGRMLLTLLLVCCAGIWGVLGVQRTVADGGVSATSASLPMVAVDYLEQDPSHRILAISAQSSATVDFTVMRTERGDIVDASPAAWAMRVSGRQDDATNAMAKAAAQLLANGDADAIQTLSGLGLGGVFVVPASGDVTNDQAYDALVSNLTASEGTQNVVSNPTGTYFRLTVSDVASQGVNLDGEAHARANTWRWVWLWSVGVIVVLYCLVAIPSIRRREQEQA